jgi:glycosyl hydrolase family 26
MPFAGPPTGRLRDFFSARRGVASVLVVVVALVGAGAFAFVGDRDTEEPEQPEPGMRVHVPDPEVPPPDPVTPSGGALFGSRSFQAEKEAVQALEAHLGRTLDINHNFYTWDEQFPTQAERWDLASGRLPLISWNGKDVQSSEIAAGAQDRLIKERASAVKDLGQTVLIRWFWEMDGNKKREWAGSPTDYIAAWRRIVDIFRSEGVTNVEWVWCPNASAFNDGEAQPFYPGDDYVDWICADGYNWAPGRLGDEWRSFRDIFGGFYAWASQKNKKIMVGEFGVQERSGDEKARWVEEARTTLKTDFSLIKAVVYFNADADYDWRMNTSPSAYRAFRDMARDPWFNLPVDRRLAK